MTRKSGLPGTNPGSRRNYNKQGLAKAGISMNANGNGVNLALPPEAQLAMMREEQSKREARQELQSLINFRSTCAMNNLGCMLQAYDISDFGSTGIDDPGHIEENVRIARKYAEALMVELKMIPSTDFFRELEKQADEETAKRQEQVGPLPSGIELP